MVAECSGIAFSLRRGLDPVSVVSNATAQRPQGNVNISPTGFFPGRAQRTPAEHVSPPSDGHAPHDPGTKNCSLPKSKVLVRIAEHVLVPIRLLSDEVQFAHAVCAGVAETRGRAINNRSAARQEALAEIHIFEPDGAKLWIKAI